MDVMSPLDDLPSMLSYIVLWVFVIPGIFLTLVCLLMKVTSTNYALLNRIWRCSGSSGRKIKQPPSP